MPPGTIMNEQMHKEVDKADAALKGGRQDEALRILLEVVRALIPYPADYLS